MLIHVGFVYAYIIKRLWIWSISPWSRGSITIDIWMKVKPWQITTCDAYQELYCWCLMTYGQDITLNLITILSFMLYTNVGLVSSFLDTIQASMMRTPSFCISIWYTLLRIFFCSQYTWVKYHTRTFIPR